MAVFPSDSIRTKNWGSEILTDADLEAQLDLLHAYFQAALNSSTGHAHDGTSNQGPLLTTLGTLTTILKEDKGADVASAAGNIVLGNDGNFFDITGTAAITSITIKPTGTMVTLQTDSTASLVDGGNLKLAGNFQGAAESTITLRSDGTNWFEVARQPAFTPSVTNSLSGSVIQTIYSESAAQVAVTAVYNNDDTAPLYSEGNVIISGTITPNNASNKIRATFSAFGVAGGAMNMIVYLCDATGSDPSLQTNGFGLMTSTAKYPLHLTKTVTAGGTSAITFYILGAVDTSTFNVASSSFWGDTSFITLTLEEIKA